MNTKKRLKLLAKKMLPVPIYRWLAGTYCRIFKGWIPVGKVTMGDFARLTPVSRQWGFDRGQPIDRYYIENFLASHSSDIHGRVLGIGDTRYIKKFGGSRVTNSDVLNVKEGAPGATIIADLTDTGQIPSDTFDCLIVTQTLQYIYDVRSAVKTMFRILKPGGVALVTVPGITPILDQEWAGSWYWALTKVSARRLFEEVFPAGSVFVEVFGNVLTATAFLQGLAAGELTKEQLDYVDPVYQVLITIKAVKPEKTQ